MQHLRVLCNTKRESRLKKIFKSTIPLLLLHVPSSSHWVYTKVGSIFCFVSIHAHSAELSQPGCQDLQRVSLMGIKENQMFLSSQVCRHSPTMKHSLKGVNRLFFHFAQPSDVLEIQFTQCFKWSFHTDQTQHCFSTYTDFKCAFSWFTFLVFFISRKIVPTRVNRNLSMVFS